MKFSLAPLKPRNPWVAAGHQRHAGSHRLSAGAMRQCAKAALRRELRAAPHEQHSP